ncbi:phage tail spike protein [Bacillus nitratireducens]|uniref:phage tail spike protein n=1 Tax=Bacillus nitratireducens TaxID=2026193 RepID=UPI000BFCCDE1|nr:phage tail spike protein [Bacillus nitratireducens]MDR4172136.1 peptidase S74 [Bacillus nitratireducens]PGW31231.1 peptidase S74 [Bacillus cereus]
MRTPSGELHVVDFKTEQIVASIQPKDYWDDERHWEIKNNIDKLEFRVFDNTRHSSSLMQQNLVLKEVRDGRIVPYVITEIEKDSDDRSVIAYASGEWIQLSKAGIIPPQRFESKTAHELTAVALAGTKYEIGNIEYSSFRTMIIDEFIDPLSFLKKIASLFELEIQYRIEVVGTRIKRYVDMIKKRGRETGKEVTIGKDLIGIKRIENSQNICTALLGFVKKEGGEFVTIAEINKGIPYLVDSDAFQRWNEKGQHKFGFYVPETEDQDMDSKRLMTLMNTELKKRVNTSVSYEVEAQSIGRVFGLAHELINEGDTIRIKDTGFTPKLYLEARAIVGDESYKNPLQDKYVFGDYHEIVDPNEELRKIYNRILSSLGNKQEMIDQLDKLVKEANETASNAKKESEAAKTLAEKVKENIEKNTVEIIEAKNPPTTGLINRKTLWQDISNGKPGILKLWKDGIWDPIIPDIESVKEEITGQYNEVKETLQGVSRTIVDIKNDQGTIEKKVTAIEQTASGLSSTVSDLNNIVDGQGKKLTDANSKIEQQATAIGAKVELKQVENYVAGFKIPELKQTVDQNKKDLLGELANKLATEQFNQKMTLVDNRFTINEQGINAAAKKTEVYTIEQANGQFAKDSYVRDMETRLQLTEQGVSISVKENDVIAAFNMSKENIKLNAARIDLIGKVNAEWIKSGLLSGCQIRTSNTNNYVSLDDQFVRLYESGVARAFLGYYRREDGAVQPTFILGSDEKTSAPAGALFMSQSGAGWPQAYANIGISEGIVDGEIKKSVYWELQRNGLSVLNANDYHVFYSGNGNWYFRRGKTGLYQSTLAIEDNGSDADLRLPNITLRNSRVAGYAGVLQVKSSVTQNGWGAVQGNFMSPSLREYKSNIRDVSFSALEKIRNVKIRQFNYKNAVNELYKMREEKNPNDPPLTTNDIKTYYGAIVDETDEAFVDESGKGMHLYSYASLTIKGLQELEVKQDEKIKALEEKHDRELQALEEKNKSDMEQMNRRVEALEQLLNQ